MLRKIKKYILELALKQKTTSPKGSLSPVGSGSHGAVMSLPVGSARGDRAVHPSVATVGPSVSMMRVLGTLLNQGWPLRVADRGDHVSS